jgi:uncharacterized membrane protein
MDKMIIIVFDSASKAFEGCRALGELHSQGSISLYAMAVIAKNASNGEVTIKRTNDRDGLGTAVDLVAGILIGLLGGPENAALGAGAGTLGGHLCDLANLGIGVDFLDEVGQHLLPGGAAVIADVWEEWVMPVDTRMESAGGTVLRRARGEVLDALIERNVEAARADVACLKAERDRAFGHAKAKLQAKIDAAKARLQATQDRASAAFKAAKREMDAKMNYLQEQAAKARGDMKVKLGARVAKACLEYKQRTYKLDQTREDDKHAWKLTEEALEV